MNISNNLENAASYFPNRPVLSEAGNEITYSEFNHRTNLVASGLLTFGVKPGEHIGLLAPNSANWLIFYFYFGVLKAGAVALTLSGVLTGEDLRNLVSHSGPRFIYEMSVCNQKIESPTSWAQLKSRTVYRLDSQHDVQNISLQILQEAICFEPDRD